MTTDELDAPPLSSLSAIVGVDVGDMGAYKTQKKSKVRNAFMCIPEVVYVNIKKRERHGHHLQMITSLDNMPHANVRFILSVKPLFTRSFSIDE